ncbi:sensor histidine kinase [Lacibacter luteus]|uniref:histidine kinase n=1 Tax=Lacibacter luteus TaxID=2508719 RepID=A0A4Q1CJZ8_9BACT|nr:ATP-binding protein [Lacibacter luteus]RXK60662.1 sensor histidine kinase [Lacibacter luteus]
MSSKYFKVSSALKNLIGSDLITDNFVAVFELVKNSFDARATEVKIIFKDIYSNNAQIIIQDNGKGMDYKDLTEKWLFLGYSAKRDNTEDDYRDKIKSGRVYAGAKGVGRFSCDRLGKYLNLTTVSKKPNSRIENIFVDWSKFEKNQKVLFEQIPVVHSVAQKTNYNLKHGTILEISGVPVDFWNRDNFKKLKEKLSKLIRPDLNSSDDLQKFKIILSVPDEESKDKEILKEKGNNEIHQYYSTINGEIKNFVFNELDIKTTKIESQIDNTGIITTRLTDRENFIYEIKEKSQFDLLSNINITLYFLNRSGKITFHKRTGVEHVDFGSLFVYKNGFRIYPYGERGDDSLRLENRALQGYARYIGLRSLIGEISIGNSNEDLRETTSRGDGLVKTKAYEQLTNTDDGYLIQTLRRLEKYVVDVTQWGVNSDDENIDLTSKKAIEGLVKLIANISDKQTLELKYNKDIINLISLREEKSAKKLVQNFKRIAAESNDKNLYKEAQKIEKAITSSLKRADSAEKERDAKIIEKKQVEKELEKKKEQLSIANSIASQDIDNVTNLHHQVRVITDVIKTELLLFSRKLGKGAIISNEELKDFIEKISFENNKIEAISKFGSRAIFENFTDISKADLAGFIENYVNKISNYFSSTKTKVLFQNNLKSPFEIRFRPLDVSIIIDNMISNSKKADATSLYIELNKSNDKELNICFRDNGKGISKEIKDVNEIFVKTFSTTRSTGLGLYHIMNIITENKWEISVNTNNPKGVQFNIIVKK